jgi:DNA-binding GntR family transcriptional regulator
MRSSRCSIVASRLGPGIASNYDHRAIVAALREGNAEGAGRLLSEHVFKGKARPMRTVK